MNIYRSLAPLGVGTAAMAAALLGDGGEAEAGAIPRLGEKIEAAIRNGSRRRFYAGTLEEQAFNDLKNIFDKDELSAPRKVLLDGHVDRRSFDNPESVLSPYAIGRYWEDLLNGTSTRGAKNYPPTPRSKGKERGEAAIFGGGDEYTTPFAPLKFGTQIWHGNEEPVFFGKTIIETPNKKLLSHLASTNWAKEVRSTPHVSSAPEPRRGGNYSQRDRFSAGNAQSDESSLPEIASSVNKKVIPAALLAAALGGDAAQAVESGASSGASGGNLRALGIGARDVLEGLGEGVGFFSNPFANLLNAAAGGSPTYFSEANAGRALADLLGLPAAQGDAEKLLSGISRGAASVLPTMGAGVALNAAKTAPLLANDLLASPRVQAGNVCGHRLAVVSLKSPPGKVRHFLLRHALKVQFQGWHGGHGFFKSGDCFQTFEALQ